jgi:hypothetical protein
MWVDEDFKIEGNQLTGNKGDIYVYNAEKIPLELTFETNKVLREINQESGSSNTNDVDDKKPIFTAENVKQPTSSSSIDKRVASTIGKPFKISNLEVVQKDFPNVMNWNDAKEACAELGDGWRLPTKDELNILYNNKDKIGGFANSYYWSSTESGSFFAYYQYFVSGIQTYNFKDSAYYVRAIRAF